MNHCRLGTFLAILLLCGCEGTSRTSGATPGSEAAAKKHFHDEFQKWLAGQENQVSTMKSRTQVLLAPISYNVRSTVPDKPDALAKSSGSKLPDDWEQWPAYRLNVAIEWKSKAGTPIEKITAYRFTWNTQEAKWYVAERFE